MVNLVLTTLNEAGQILRMYEHVGDAFCVLVEKHGGDCVPQLREEMHSILDSALTAALAFPPPGVELPQELPETIGAGG